MVKPKESVTCELSIAKHPKHQVRSAQLKKSTAGGTVKALYWNREDDRPADDDENWATLESDEALRLAITKKGGTLWIRCSGATQYTIEVQ